MKYSKQKQELFEIMTDGGLRHPTADEVYRAMRKRRPNVSMGTVYRNLSLLTEKGLITKLCGIDGADRFDCDTLSHGHFKCKVCGAIFDFDLAGTAQSLSALKGFLVESENLVVYGVCPDCRRNIENRAQRKSSSTNKEKK